MDIIDLYQQLVYFFLETRSNICRNSPNAKSDIFLPQRRCIPLKFRVSKHEEEF